MGSIRMSGPNVRMSVRGREGSREIKEGVRLWIYKGGWDVETREASNLLLACATGTTNQKCGAIAMVASINLRR
jgi:hypothetical protein